MQDWFVFLRERIIIGNFYNKFNFQVSDIEVCRTESAEEADSSPGLLRSPAVA